MTHDISEVTRRALVDLFGASRVSWSGALDEDAFLSRLYDLSALPSKDYRYRNAASDIHQHCVRNCDWDAEWVFYDSRFNLLRAPDKEFLAFLCESLHPIVRPVTDDAKELVGSINKELAADGWELTPIKEISGRPVFGAQKMGSRATIFEEPTGWAKVDRQMQEMRLRLDRAGSEEQYQAVGLLCREVLISVAQEVYDHRRHAALDGVLPSDTDAKRMLESIFENDFKGASNEEARAHAKAAVRLALALQHKRTADFRTAALCAEGTCSVVNMLAIVAGRRERTIQQVNMST